MPCGADRRGTARLQTMVISQVRLALVASLMVLAPACRQQHTVDPLTPRAKIARDLQTLCGRVQARDMSAWSQPAMMTDEVQNLTIRMDQGDRGARCELGRLMHELAPESCETTADELVMRCD